MAGFEAKRGSDKKICSAVGFITRCREPIDQQRRNSTEQDTWGRPRPARKRTPTYTSGFSTSWDLSVYSEQQLRSVTMLIVERRSVSEVTQEMQTIQKSRSIAQKTTGSVSPSGRISIPHSHTSGCVFSFDAFDTKKCKLSNEKTQYGAGYLTRLTDLTPNEMGVYVTRTHSRAPARSPARPVSTYTPFNCRQIRQIRQIARLRRGKMDFLTPPGVNPVKWNQKNDNLVI